MPYLDYTFLLKNKVIGKYFGMNLDLARRFQNIYEPGLSFEDLIEGLHARQITDAALRRVLLHIVLHMKYYPFLEEAKDIPIPYARILGFSKSSSPLLKEYVKMPLWISSNVLQRAKNFIPTVQHRHRFTV